MKHCFRTIIAALHFNENNNRLQASDQTGKERYSLVYRKSKKDYSIQEVKVDCTFGKCSFTLTSSDFWYKSYFCVVRFASTYKIMAHWISMKEVEE